MSALLSGRPAARGSARSCRPSTWPRPWALVALPLPLLAARLIPAEPEGGSGALRVPGTLVGGARSGADLAARGRRRAALTWTLWIALVAALSAVRASSCRPPRSRPRAARS